MQRLFEKMTLGKLTLANRFIFPPIKTAYGTPKGNVTDRHLTYYGQIAENGPGLLILEPVSVTAEGKEHPKQLCIHLPESADELKKIVGVIHAKNRLACLHLNHAGAAANPKATGVIPKAPSALTCPTSGASSEPLTETEIGGIVEGYRSAAEKAVIAGFDAIEVQAGHGYLVSQFLNSKINRRTDRYGQNRLLFAEEVLAAVKAGAPDLTFILRISGNEMSPDFGIAPDDLAPLLKMAKSSGIHAVHVGMGSACFSPPWYFHHARLPEKPQMDALAWVRTQTNLPVIAAGRMGRVDRTVQVIDENLADLVALGRPLIADPDLIEKWRAEKPDEVRYCGYCLQGCLHRVKNGEPIGCNVNPEIGQPVLEQSSKLMNVLVAGGGPAGMSAALYLSKRGHRVTLVEREKRLGGQFNLAWQAPGKQKMQDGLDHLAFCVNANAETVLTGKTVDMDLVADVKPDLLVWATGAHQKVPIIQGVDSQYAMTSIEYFSGAKSVKGPRVLVIGAGRTGLEIVEKLGADGLDVTATKRTDPIGSMMEMITKKLTLMRIEQMSNVTLMPHTTVKGFETGKVVVEKDGGTIELAPFDTVIFASGMLSAPGPEPAIAQAVPSVEVIGDAENVMDIFTAVHAGYALASKY
ncbi:FAD-dependent oxidoreductase [uncultured Desulfosarcina sp.]|uniref:FAD-dependent oxidoreductase n=1 Tax=uncultured Desulfosarcina sp. TaxID=218289 RepID=UPI0029C837ED|nr:FAD-dependent oxidoreductase [uncultured Desulfosarcina sp.]